MDVVFLFISKCDRKFRYESWHFLNSLLLDLVHSQRTRKKNTGEMREKTAIKYMKIGDYDIHFQHMDIETGAININSFFLLHERINGFHMHKFHSQMTSFAISLNARIKALKFHAKCNRKISSAFEWMERWKKNMDKYKLWWQWLCFFISLNHNSRQTALNIRVNGEWRIPNGFDIKIVQFFLLLLFTTSH